MIPPVPGISPFGVARAGSAGSLCAHDRKAAQIVKERTATRAPALGADEGHRYTQRPNTKPTAKRRVVKITKVQGG